MIWAFWGLFTLLMAAGQGLCMPAIRRTPEGSEARQQAFALHYLFAGAYFLPLWMLPELGNFLVASMVRFVAFDALLNLAAGDPAFNVGNTAFTDKAQQWVANRIGVSATGINAFIKVFGMALIAVLYKWKAHILCLTL